jgi:hypothetical protein
MASPTTLDINGDRSVMMITYTLTTADHTGDAVAWCDWADRSVTFTSSAWGGATAALEGSNDGTTWVPLTDPQGTAITRTANGIEAAVELTRFVRAKLTTAGTGATVTASIIMRKGK